MIFVKYNLKKYNNLIINIRAEKTKKISILFSKNFVLIKKFLILYIQYFFAFLRRRNEKSFD